MAAGPKGGRQSERTLTNSMVACCVSDGDWLHLGPGLVWGPCWPGRSRSGAAGLEIQGATHRTGYEDFHAHGSGRDAQPHRAVRPARDGSGRGVRALGGGGRRPVDRRRRRWLRSAALRAYAAWLDQDVDLLVGPYASGLVRAVAPLVCDAGRLLYNHGGSADDLARPGLVSLPAPASTYFDGAVQEAMARQVDRLLVVCGPGRFARAVAAGAVARASEREIEAQTVMVGLADRRRRRRRRRVGRWSFRGGRGGGSPCPWVAASSGAVWAAVAAGLPAFGEQLGPAAEDVLGPVQWWPSSAATRGRAIRSRLRRPLSAPDWQGALVCGGPGRGRGLPGTCRPPPGLGGRDGAAVDDLNVAGELCPGCRLAPGRPPRADHPVAARPDGPGRPGSGGRLGLD